MFPHCYGSIATSTSKKDLSGLVRDVGFTLVKAQYFDLAGIIPWYINFVLLRNSIGSGSVSLYDKLVVPTMRLIESVIPPPIGKGVDDAPEAWYNRFTATV